MKCDNNLCSSYLAMHPLHYHYRIAYFSEIILLSLFCFYSLYLFAFPLSIISITFLHTSLIVCMSSKKILNSVSQVASSPLKNFSTTKLSKSFTLTAYGLCIIISVYVFSNGSLRCIVIYPSSDTRICAADAPALLPATCCWVLRLLGIPCLRLCLWLINVLTPLKPRYHDLQICKHIIILTTM